MQSGHLRLLFGATAALTAFVVAAVPASTLGRGGDLPPLPHLPKPDDKAVFDLIVEGHGGAGQSVTGSGSTGVCSISTNTNSSQSYEYGRGRNLRVVLSKYKLPGGPLFLIRREGQRKPYFDFTVKGSYESEATGTASRSGPAVSCQPITETVGDEEECGPSGDRRTDLFMNVDVDGDLTLNPADPSTGIPGFGCGANGVETLSGDPLYGWPNFPSLRPERLPAGDVFGRKRAFKIEFESRLIAEEEFATVGSVELRSLNTADHSAVARFVRVRGAKK